MPVASQRDVNEILKSVARTPDAPKVVFPYGAKVVERAGEFVLQPMTPDEFRSLIKAELGKELSDDELRNQHCGFTGYFCEASQCTAVGGHCAMVASDSGVACYCDK